MTRQYEHNPEDYTLKTSDLTHSLNDWTWIPQNSEDSFSHNFFNTLNTELNPICHLLALLGAQHIFQVSRIRVNIPTNAHNIYALKGTKIHIKKT
jgi:hypothetical protein